MSVSVFKVHYISVPQWGKYEALWLEAHVGLNEDNMIYLNENQIDEYIERAEKSERNWSSQRPFGFHPEKEFEIHKEITKRMREDIKEVLKGEQGCCDISIGY